MKPTLVAIAAAAAALPVSHGAPATIAKAPLRATLLSGPPAHPVAGVSWRILLRVRRGSRPYSGPPPILRGSGDVPLRPPQTDRAPRRVRRERAAFPASGPWRLEAVVGGKRFPLGGYAVDVPVSELVREPFWVTALPDSSLLIAQRRGPLVRWNAGQLSVFSQLQPVHNLSVTPGGIVLASESVRVHRLALTGETAQPPLTFGVDPVAAGDSAGNVDAALYENRVVRVDPGGTVTPFAGTGEEGFSGDGGLATSARLFHPHDIAVGPGGAVYIADTENGRIRRVDPATGLITSYGENVGVPVSLDVAHDGTVYSTGVARSNPGRCLADDGGGQHDHRERPCELRHSRGRRRHLRLPVARMACGTDRHRARHHPNHPARALAGLAAFGGATAASRRPDLKRRKVDRGLFDRSLAVRAHPPVLLERALQLRQACRASSCRRGRRGSPRRPPRGRPGNTSHAEQAFLHRLDLQLALPHVLEVFRRPEEHVDQSAQVRRDQAQDDRHRNEHRIFDSALRVLVDPVADRRARR